MANLYQIIANNIRTALPRDIKAFELCAHVYSQYSFSATSGEAAENTVITAPVLPDSGVRVLPVLPSTVFRPSRP